jgi:hypothetical protein
VDDYGRVLFTFAEMILMKKITVDHGEHIIQQAIGGSLVSKGILCKKCLGETPAVK